MSNPNPVVAAALARLNPQQGANHQANMPVQFPPEATPKATGPREPKTYYNRYANSCFQVQIAPTQSRQLIFHGPANGVGEYTTSDPIEQDQLDSCADQVGCPIFTKRAVVDAGEADAQKQIREQAAKAAIAAGQAKTE